MSCRSLQRTMVVAFFASLVLSLVSTTTWGQTPPPALFIVRGHFLWSQFDEAHYEFDSSESTGEYSLAINGKGDLVQGTFGPSSATVNLHIFSEAGDIFTRDIGNVEVYVRGEPGTKFHLEYSYTERGFARNQSSYPQEVGVDYWSFQEFHLRVQSGSQDVITIPGGGVVDGVTGGPTISYQGVTYSYGWSPGHWIEMGPNGCCGDGYSAHMEADWIVNITASSFCEVMIVEPMDGSDFDLTMSRHTATELTFSAIEPSGQQINWGLNLEYQTSGGRGPFTNGRIFSTTSDENHTEQ